MKTKLPTIQQIEERRKFLGMSKGALCAEANISYPTYKRYVEEGTNQANIASLRDALARFAKSL